MKGLLFIMVFTHLISNLSKRLVSSVVVVFIVLVLNVVGLSDWYPKQSAPRFQPDKFCTYSLKTFLVIGCKS